MRTELHGLGVSAGSAAGPAMRLGTPPKLPGPEPVAADRQTEADRAVAALEAVGEFLRGRAATAGGAAADVLAAEAMMACDPVLAGKVRGLAGAGRAAAWAVSAALASYREMLTAAGGYLAERAADLDDIADRAVALLLGEPMPGIPAPGHPFVLLAADLAPADTATLAPSAVLAIVTERGGPTNHTSILAKTLGIPAVVCCPGIASVADGTVLAVDGSAGTVVVDGRNARAASTTAGMPSPDRGVVSRAAAFMTISQDGAQRLEARLDLGVADRGFAFPRRAPRACARSAADAPPGPPRARPSASASSTRRASPARDAGARPRRAGSRGSVRAARAPPGRSPRARAPGPRASRISSSISASTSARSAPRRAASPVRASQSARSASTARA